METAKTPKITGPAFKLAKSAKYLLANETDRHRRGALKRALIKAQVESLKQPPPAKKRDGRSLSDQLKATVEADAEE